MPEEKTHHCFNCGAETEECDEIGRQKVYICDDPKCIKEFHAQCQIAENEKRWRAEEDNYDRY